MTLVDVVKWILLFKQLVKFLTTHHLGRFRCGVVVVDSHSIVDLGLDVVETAGEQLVVHVCVLIAHFVAQLGGSPDQAVNEALLDNTATS